MVWAGFRVYKHGVSQFHPSTPHCNDLIVFDCGLDEWVDPAAVTVTGEPPATRDKHTVALYVSHPQRSS